MRWWYWEIYRLYAKWKNDDSLSPTPFSSNNIKVEEPAMDNRDEFSKWIDTVEEALANENAGALGVIAPAQQQDPICDCGNWQCPICFPEQDEFTAQQDACPTCGHAINTHNHSHDQDDSDEAVEIMPVDLETMALAQVEEEDMNFDVIPEKPRSGKGVKLGNIIQKFVPANQSGEESPLTYGEDNLDEEGWYDPSDADVGFGDQAEDEERNTMIDSIIYMQDAGLSNSSQRYDPDQLAVTQIDKLKQIHDAVMGTVSEDDIPQNSDMGSAGIPASGGATYLPGTAPTMPESIQQGMTMENVDKDISTWLDRFKAYDELRASKMPVMEKKAKPDFLDVDKDEDKKESWKKAEKDKEAVKESDGERNPWEKLASDKKDDKDEVGKETKTHKGGTVTKTKTGIIHKKADESVEVKENADPEVLEWMQRFSKLGNMKGYGR